MRWQLRRAVRRNLQSQGQFKRRTRSFFLFVVLPAWLGPGLLDWYCHRRTHIEDPENGGFPESLVHSAMFTEAGMPLILSASFEMNPLIISLMTGAAVLHEVTAMADVRLAMKSRRYLSQWEQHIHSFLEVMPFWVVPLMVLLHEPTTQGWSFVRRSSALAKRDLVIVGAAVAAAGVLPYAEEMLRCARHQRSVTGPSASPAERLLSLLRGGGGWTPDPESVARTVPGRNEPSKNASALEAG